MFQRVRPQRSFRLAGSDVSLRAMTAADIATAAAIEVAAHERPMCLDEVEFMVLSPGVDGLVATGDGVACGFAVFERESYPTRLLDIAVLPAMQRRGVGRMLVGNLSLRGPLSLRVRESNLDAQLFFRAVGFRADMVDREFYRDTGEDAYRMVLARRGTGR